MSPVGYGLRRPVARWEGGRKYAACPQCSADVSDTLGSPAIDTLRLADQNSTPVDRDTLNIRGYQCDDCEYVLAIGPGATAVDVHDPRVDDEPTAPWIPLGAVFADGSKRPVVAPRREVSQ